MAVVQRSDRTARVISHVRPLVTIAARSGAELTWGADGCEARARVYGVMEFLIVCASQENDCDDSFR